MFRILKNILFYILIYVSSAHFVYFDHNHYHHVQSLKPLEIMVDVVNNLAFRVLYCHAAIDYENRDNFAFSPTTLTGVLVGLIEGSSGKSAFEIRKVLNLPGNLDIIRIGYRDIQKKLQTYVLDQDNPLHGLTLSRGDIKITPEYENILKFYSFELAEDMKGSVFNKTSDTESMQTTRHFNDNGTTVAPTADAITMSSLKPIVTATYSQTSETMKMIESTSTESLTIISHEESTTEEPTTVMTETKTTTTTTTTSPTITTMSPPRTTPPPTTTTTTTEPTTIASIAPYPQNTLGRLFPTRRSPSPLRSTTFKNQTRIKRHQQYPYVYVPFHGTVWEQEEFIHTYRSFDAQIRIAHRNDFIDHLFYLNSMETLQTSYRIYNSVLNYGFIQELKASAIELELDSKNYNLLLIIPNQIDNLNFLQAALKFAPTLNVIRSSLKPKWIQAIIPDFNLQGRIYLTKTLQKMGIIEIFEPNKAYLHPMTDENGIYVKHIEQLISLRIRTHPATQFRRNAAPTQYPLQVHANRPFLFFVIDIELGVSIICGCVMNPLNVRIQ